jgi:hypothetical protein
MIWELIELLSKKLAGHHIFGEIVHLIKGELLHCLREKG